MCTERVEKSFSCVRLDQKSEKRRVRSKETGISKKLDPQQRGERKGRGMEGCGKEREQEVTVSSAIQGRDSSRDRRGTDEGSSGWSINESSESSSQFCQTTNQTENRAREFWGQVGRQQAVNSNSNLSSESRDIFRVVYTNARSIIGKIDMLKAYIYDLKPAAVCICEASTNDSVSNAFLALDGYYLAVRADGKDTKQGWCRGLLMYLRTDIKAERLESGLVKNMVECEGVKIPWGNKGDMLSLLLVYRPPRPPGSEADNGYCDMFCDLLASLKSPACIIGDLNFSGIDWDHLSASSGAEKRVLDAVQNHFWVQNVYFPTRKDLFSGAESLLDPCLTSSPELVRNVESYGWFSDHAIYSVDLARPSLQNCTKELVPDWSKANFDRLVGNLEQLDWSVLECMSGLDGWEFIKCKIDEETESCVPKKLRRTSSRPLWMTKNVMSLIRKKRRLWKYYSSSRYTRIDYEEFKAYKKVQEEVKKAVRNAKRNFERKLAKDVRKNNTKPFYSYMKRRTDNRVSVGPLKDNSGQLVTDDENMAEILNDFFCSVFTREDVSVIPEAEQRYHGVDPLVNVHITATKLKLNLKN